MNSSAGNALREFSEGGWPKDKEGILKLVSPLESDYGVPKISSERFPDFGPSIMKDGKVAYISPITHQWETNPDLFPVIGMRWTLEFNSGQKISVVISNEGKLLERTYTDNGDIHMREVVKFLRGWQKSIEQAQHGGRSKGVRPREVILKYNRILNYRRSPDWILRTDSEFLKFHHDISKKELERAINWEYDGKPGLEKLKKPGS